METKKQIILLVLNELNANSDKKNPLTQTQIADTISKVYPCDRKTVGRNIKFLQEMGYPITKSQKGYYVDKTFSLDEITFVKEAILTAKDKTEEEKEDLAERIAFALLRVYRRR